MNIGQLLQVQPRPGGRQRLIFARIRSHVFIQESRKLCCHLPGIKWLVFHQGIGGKRIVAPVGFQSSAPIEGAVLQCGKCQEEIRVPVRLAGKIREYTCHFKIEFVVDL